jgi:hypothetical protein
MRTRSIGFVLLAMTALWPVTASAQTVTGTIQGVVTDITGAVVPGATVRITNTETGATRDVTTNAVGFYTATFVPIGRYTVTASLSGFAVVIREDVDVGLNQTRVADFQLKQAAREETVRVTGAATPINTVNAEVRGSLTAQQIADKPTLNPGSFLSLAETFAGFQENPTSGQNNPTASSGSSINFNGTGTRGATFQINGVNNDDSSENQNRQGVSLATIKEFQVLTNTYSAEFGRAFGGVVLVQTKSGTNQWRGEVYEFMQDSNQLTALANFALTKPDNQRHQYGGTLGFPILPSRLFGFASFDRVRFKGNQNYARDILLSTERVPRLTRDNDTPENRAWIQSIIDRFPAVAPNDPRSSRTYATTQGIDRPAGDYSGRLDWQRDTDNISALYQYTHQIFASDDVVAGEAARQDHRQQNLGLTWTRVFSASMVGEVRYGLGIRDTNVNIASGNDTPIVRFTGSPVSGSTIGNAGNFPILRDQYDNQFVGNVSWQLGQHSFKTGVDIRRMQLDDFADNSSRGTWTFDRVCGGVTYPTAYDAFLDGCIASYVKGYGPFFLENRISEANIYAEDSWRIQPSLTVNLGLRYEYISAPKEVGGRINYGFGADTDNIEPRLSAAWVLPARPGWSEWLTGREYGDASVRGGFGATHGRIFQSVFSQTGASLRTNPPDALSRTYNTLPGLLSVSDPSLGFVFVPGPQTARHSITIASANLEVPETRQWSLTYERKLPLDSSVRINYNGNHVPNNLKYGLGNLPQSPLVGPVTVVNHPNNAPAAGFPDLRGKVIDRIAADVQCAGTGLPGLGTNATCPVVVPIADNEISLRVPRTNERRPDPQYSTNLVVSNDAKSWYDGVQIEWTKRLGSGVQFTTSYTRSRSDDTTSEATFVGAGDSNQQGPNSAYARGYSRFHTPHRFAFSGSWLMPYFRDRRDVVGLALGGWQLSGVVRLTSGTPFTVIQTGLDLDFDGFAEGRPVLLEPSILGRTINDPATAREQLPLSAFRPYTVGDSLDSVVGRNTFYGDGLQMLDLGLYKNFVLGGTRSLSIRVEAYNVFKAVQYAFPALNISTPTTFGAITGNNGLYLPRTVQLAFRFKF